MSCMRQGSTGRGTTSPAWKCGGMRLLSRNGSACMECYSNHQSDWLRLFSEVQRLRVVLRTRHTEQGRSRQMPTHAFSGRKGKATCHRRRRRSTHVDTIGIDYVATTRPRHSVEAKNTRRVAVRSEEISSRQLSTATRLGVYNDAGQTVA